jgi:hypothetical protein
MQTKLIASTLLSNGDEITLHQLGGGWDPWTHQVARSVEDGKDYGRPGVRIVVFSGNHLNSTDATRAFVQMGGLLSNQFKEGK